MEEIVKVTGSSTEPRNTFEPTFHVKGHVYYAKVGGQYYQINSKSFGPVSIENENELTEKLFPSTWKRKKGSTQFNGESVSFECYCDSRGLFAGFCLIETKTLQPISDKRFLQITDSITVFSNRLRYEWVFNSINRFAGKLVLEKSSDRVFLNISDEFAVESSSVKITVHYADAVEDSATLYPGDYFASLKHSSKILALHIENKQKVQVALTAIRFYPRGTT